jgi:FkbM family methyltransferase
MSLLRRFSGYLTTARDLRAGGVRLGSILVYPVARRMRGVNELHLRSGLQLVAPREEPLLSLFREVWVERRYLPARSSLAPDATIVDIGANVGVFAVWASLLVPLGRVFAVEPSRAMFAFLEKNIERNALTNVVAIPSAVSGTDGRSAFFSRGPGVMNTLYSVDNYQSRFQKLEDVDSVTLDTLFTRWRIDRCDLLKLDCEGAEYEILLNASPQAFRRIRALAVEYHVGLNEHRPEELVRVLASHGFQARIEPLQDIESGYLYASRRTLDLSCSVARRLDAERARDAGRDLPGPD